MNSKTYKDIHIYLYVRKIDITKERIILRDEVETIYEKRTTPFGNSAKLDVPKKYIDRRAYVIILKD